MFLLLNLTRHKISDREPRKGDGLVRKNANLPPRCRDGSTPVPAKSSEFWLLPRTMA
jgi:hypothetical protein